MMGGQLLLSWSELIYSVPGYRPMSPVPAPFWHTAGTGGLFVPN
jgi:hypothetical protein